MKKFLYSLIVLNFVFIQSLLGSNTISTLTNTDILDTYLDESNGSLYTMGFGDKTIRKIDLSNNNITIIAGIENDTTATAITDGVTATSVALGGEPFSVVKVSNGDIYFNYFGSAAGNGIIRLGTDGKLYTTSVGTESNTNYLTYDGGQYIYYATASDIFKYNISNDTSTALGISGFSTSTKALYYKDNFLYVTDRAGGGTGDAKKIDLSDNSVTTLISGLNNPRGIAVDDFGNIYISDTGNHKILKIDSLGNSSTIIGDGTSGSIADGSFTSSSTVQSPYGMSVGYSNTTIDLYFGEWGAPKLRKISLPKPDITTGLVAHYEFEGNTIDSSGNGYDANATDVNITTLSGKFGQGAGFQATTSKVVLPAYPELNASDLTISTWYYSPNGSGANGHSVRLSQGTEIGYGFRDSTHASADQIEFSSWNGTYLGGFSYPTQYGAWTHLVVTLDQTTGTLKAYENGVEANSTVISGLIGGIGSTLTSAESNILGWPDATRYLDDMRMDDVRIYNRALSATEVTELYNYTPPPILVTSTEDSGSGSLREAIANANSGATIDLSALGDQNITLSSSIDINNSLTIQGNITNPIGIDGNATSRHFNIADGITVNINNLVLFNGSAATETIGFKDAGSIYLAANATLNVDNIHFVGNTTGGSAGNENGGAIQVQPGATANVKNSSFLSNSAPGGEAGAISNHGTLNIKNSTFSSNSGNYAGVIRNDSTLKIENSTFINNTASTAGGAIRTFAGTALLKNSVFYSNTAPTGPNINYESGTFTSHGYNFISDTASASALTAATNDQFHTDGTNPLLGTITQDSGGITYGFIPQSSSPLIDAGSCTAIDSSTITIDQFYNTRSDGSCDIGAIEYVHIPKLTLKAHGGAVQFDGVLGNQINLGDISALNGTSQFTLETWVNVSEITGVDQYFFSKQLDTNNRINLSINSTGRFAIATSNGANQYTYSTNTLNANQWYHVAFVYNGNGATLNDDFKLYINGNLETNFGSSATSPSTSSSSLSGINAYLGSSNVSSKVSVDEFRIWNTARTEADIKATMSQQLDGNETGLVAYYNFDERVGGTIKDITGNFDGTIEGNVTRINFLGESLDFDASGDYVEIPDSNTLDLDNSDMSISTWAKVASSGSSSATQIFNKFNETGNLAGYRLYMSNGNIRLQTADNTGTTAVTNTTNCTSNRTGLMDDMWHHYGAVFDNTNKTISLYIDGQLDIICSGVVDIAPTTLSAKIGTNYAGSFPLKGNVAQMSLYNKALTQTEIRELMHSMPDVSNSNLVGYWPMNEGGGSTVYDITGNGNHGAITGATWIDTAPTIYGNTIYKSQDIATSHQLIVENNSSIPTYSLNGSHSFIEGFSSTGSFVHVDNFIGVQTIGVSAIDNGQSLDQTLSIVSYELPFVLNITLNIPTIANKTISNIQFVGTNGNSEMLSIPSAQMSSLIEGSNSISLPILQSGGDFIVYVDLDDGSQWLYNRDNNKLYPRSMDVNSSFTYTVSSPFDSSFTLTDDASMQSNPVNSQYVYSSSTLLQLIETPISLASYDDNTSLPFQTGDKNSSYMVHMWNNGGYDTIEISKLSYTPQYNSMFEKYITIDTGDNIISDIFGGREDVTVNANELTLSLDGTPKSTMKLVETLDNTQLATAYSNIGDTISFNASDVGYRFQSKKLQTQCYIYDHGNNISNASTFNDFVQAFTYSIGDTPLIHNQYDPLKALMFADTNNGSTQLVELTFTDTTYSTVSSVQEVGTYSELTSVSCKLEQSGSEPVTTTIPSLVTLNFTNPSDGAGYFNRAFGLYNGAYKEGEYIPANSHFEYVLLDSLALGSVLSAQSYSTALTPTLSYPIAQEWNYIALPTNINICSSAYQSELTNLCYQSTTLESLFTNFDKLYRYNDGSFTYFEPTPTTNVYNADKFGLLSFKDGLLAHTPAGGSPFTLSMPYSIADLYPDFENLKLSTKGWHLVAVQYGIDVTKVNTFIANQGKTLKYILKYDADVGGEWEVYAPTDDASIDASLPRLSYIKPYEAYWILVE